MPPADANPPDDLPPGPSPMADGSPRDVVLHTRVVTETGGGPDKTILLSASYLADTRYWLAAAYMHPPNDPGFEAIRQRADEFNSPLISVPDRGATDTRVLRRLRAVCKHYNVKIWHGHDYKSNLIGLMLRPFWKMKYVTTVHGWVKHTTRTPLYYAVDRWALPFYQHVICVSDDLRDRVRELGVADDKISLIHNAIDERTYDRKRPATDAPMRAGMKTPPGRLVIGACGRLSAEKGFNHLIRAADTLLKEGLDLEVWIAGDGDARPELEQLISHLGMRDRVKLLGFCHDMIAMYEALDVFVLSSLREGLPNVVLEAMSMRVPVVSTRVAGVPRLIDDGVTGVLCPIGDGPAMADALRPVLNDASTRQRLAAAGRAKIERQYSFTQRMARIRSIYDNVLGIGDDAPLPETGDKPHARPTS